MKRDRRITNSQMPKKPTLTTFFRSTLLLIFFIPSFYAPVEAQWVIKEQEYQEPIAIQTQKTKWNKCAFYKIAAVPIVLVGLGLLATTDNNILHKMDVRDRRNELMPDFHTTADDYMQYSPIVAVNMMEMVGGIHGVHNFTDRSALLLKAELIMVAMVVPLKRITRVERPNGRSHTAFPSGHTAQAFVAATVMSKEFGPHSPWYSVGAYAVATGVGALRMMNNKHWISDVLAGAGIGILSTNIAYLIHNRRKKNRKLAVSPTYMQGSLGVFMSCSL